MISNKDVLYVSIHTKNFKTVVDYNYNITTDYETVLQEALEIILIKDGKVVLPKPTDNYVIIGLLDSTFHNFSYVIVINKGMKYQKALHILEHVKFQLEQQFNDNPRKKEEFLRITEINNKYYDSVRTFYREFINNIVRNHQESTQIATKFIESSNINNLDNVISQNLEKELRKKAKLEQITVTDRERWLETCNLNKSNFTTLLKKRTKSDESLDTFIQHSSQKMNRMIIKRKFKRFLIVSIFLFLLIVIIYLIMSSICGWKLEKCYYTPPIKKKIIIRVHQKYHMNPLETFETS